MKKIFLLAFIFISFSSFSQKLLKGIVIDPEKNKSIPSASVFLNNTSIGTKTNEEGRFELFIPDGKHELIISSIGYKTYNQPINGSELPESVTIRLLTKADEMERVVVEPYEKDGWEKWGRFFIESFIGLSNNASNCKI